MSPDSEPGGPDERTRAPGIDPGENALVVDPPVDARPPSSPPSDVWSSSTPLDAHVLWVSLVRTPRACIEQWNDTFKFEPKAGRIVTPKRDGIDNPDPIVDESPFEVVTVRSVGDLTTLGVRITEALREWHDEDVPIVVRFESISTLLQYVDLDRTCRFLDQVTGRCVAVDALAWYHLAADAHDEDTLERLYGLFDALFEVADGEWTVRRR
ncbi:hypothetical protein ACFQAS_06520 [Halopenitus salinus]|uniref:Uncharacterized protein n=1 Tax=Halopenitus salinus TaxID=1198295 RepID=A0ABD5UVE2_9EURY